MFLFARWISGGIFIGTACQKVCFLINRRFTKQQGILERILQAGGTIWKKYMDMHG
nr:MAG TPA: hypothetical protein [Caudoviricetes sp.]